MSGIGEVQHPVGDEAAGDRGHLDSTRSAELAQPVHDPLGCALRIDPALVRDDLGAAPEAAGEDTLHAVVKIGVIAREIRVAALAHLRGGDGRLRHRLEAEVVEVALLCVEARRLEPVAPPRRSGTNAKTAHVASLVGVRPRPDYSGFNPVAS